MKHNDNYNDFDSISIRIASPEQIKDLAKQTSCRCRNPADATDGPFICPEKGTCNCGEVKKAETINYRSFRPEPEGLFCEAIFGPRKNWRCHCGKYKGIKYKGMICDHCGVEVTYWHVRRERFGYIQLAAPVSHIWYFRGYPSPIGVLCGVSLRELEQILYFDAFIVLEVTDPDCFIEKHQVLQKKEYVKYSKKSREAFQVGTGAEAIREILRTIDLKVEIDNLKNVLLTTNSKQKKRKLSKQLKLYENFAKSEQRPEWMTMDVIPVIPSALRPIRSIRNGRFLTNDLNDLYRRVINQNNRLRKLIQLGSPEVILRNEKRMLQENVDALFCNQHSSPRVKDWSNRRLQSLSDRLLGKYGRFRQSVYGKLMDYSGRSVIVPDPDLKPDQCGLPKKLILTLFKPFIVKKLKDYNYVQTIRRAEEVPSKVDPDSPIWEALAEIISYHPVLLSSRPTFHRLGIQAFKPILVEGDAIRIPPLFYRMFKVAGGSDTVAVHVPITKNARLEAKLCMLATHNIRTPVNGKPAELPHPDIGLGLNFLTQTLPDHVADAEALHQAYTLQVFEPIHCKLWYRRRYANLYEIVLAYEAGKLRLHDSVQYFFTNNQEPILTTVGRVIFNQILPKGLEWTDEHTNLRVPFFNGEVTEATLTELINQSLSRFGTDATVSFLGHLQKLGFEYVPHSNFSESLAADTMPAAYRNGVGVIDYFWAAASAHNHHVSRMAAIPKATALNRRLVNVASEVVVKEEDCRTRHAISKFATENNNLASKISGRTAARNIRHPITKEILVDTGTLITPQTATLIKGVNIKEVKVRSPLTCETERGVCAKCYGTDLTTGTFVGLGQPVGLVAAQSIGELDMYQLLMASYLHRNTTPDIVSGISRLIELFETPKSKKDDITNPHYIFKTRSVLINGMRIKGEEAVWAYLIEEIQKIYQAEVLDDKHIEIIIRQMSRKIRIIDPGDTQFSPNEEIEKVLFHQENRKVDQNSGTPAKGEPILQSITIAALNVESFLAAASLKQPRKVLTEASIQGKKDPLLGIRESVMVGKLIPVGTGFKQHW